MDLLLLEQTLALMAAYPWLGVAVRVVLALAATVVVARVLNRLLDSHFSHVSQQMDVSKTSSRLLRRLAAVAVYVIGIGVAVYQIPGAKSISYGLFASAGFLGIVIGFAAQAAISNLIAGIFIALFDPFRVGDKIETNQHYGDVEDITLRHSVIRTPSNERVIVPNAKILDEYIINYSITAEKSRYPVKVGISYHDDIDEARSIMLEEADAHELTETGESKVIVKDLGDSGVILELRIWGYDRGEVWAAGQDLRETIKKRFDEEGITIPFPQRTLSYLDEGSGSDER